LLWVLVLLGLLGSAPALACMCPNRFDNFSTVAAKATVIARVRVVDYLGAEGDRPYGMKVRVLDPIRNASYDQVIEVLPKDVCVPISAQDFHFESDWVIALSDQHERGAGGGLFLDTCAESALRMKGNRAVGRQDIDGWHGKEVPLQTLVRMYAKPPE
jgi:hypothetical protein